MTKQLNQSRRRRRRRRNVWSSNRTGEKPSFAIPASVALLSSIHRHNVSRRTLPTRARNKRLARILFGPDPDLPGG